MPKGLPAARLLLVVSLAVLCACSAPADETWMRIVSILDSEEGTAVSVLAVNLCDRQTDAVDVVVENATIIVGTTGGGGVPITVYRALVEYALEAVDLPEYEYGVSLFLPAPGTEQVGIFTEPGTLAGLPVAPASLKTWILRNVPTHLRAVPFSVVATITLRGRTEEGREIETSADLTLVFH